MREKLPENKIKLIETICIIALICFAVISYLFTKKNTDIIKGNIIVTVDGTELTTIVGKPIDINTDMTFTINCENSGYNIIEIKNKKVRCIEANCPDKICVNHSYLRDDIDNDMIICAPHKVFIGFSSQN